MTISTHVTSNLKMCFKSIHFRKRKPVNFSHIIERLSGHLDSSFESESEWNKFLAEFGHMWNEWCYAWVYLKK